MLTDQKPSLESRSFISLALLPYSCLQKDTACVENLQLVSKKTNSHFLSLGYVCNEFMKEKKVQSLCIPETEKSHFRRSSRHTAILGGVKTGF